LATSGSGIRWRGSARHRSVLSGRLARLEQAGVIARRRYSEHPPRDEYLLTDAGRELAPLLLALKTMGPTVTAATASRPPSSHNCGAELHTETVCAACRGPVEFSDLRVTGGTHPPAIVVGAPNAEPTDA
jgi:hypothetical protein